MKAFLPLLALAVPACGPAPQAPAQRSEEGPRASSVGQALCRLGFTAVPLQELATGHHVVDVALNGRRGTFVVDTGANVTVIHAPFASQFGLRPGAASRGGAIGVGGAQQASQVRIESLAIGAVPIRLRRIVITDLSQVAHVLAPLAKRPVHGIIGQDVLKEHRAVIDVSRAVAHLVHADEEPAPVPAARCAGSSKR